MNPPVDAWENPPPPGTEVSPEEDERLSTSRSKPRDSISHHKSKDYERYDSDFHTRSHRRSRSRSRHRSTRDRRHYSRDKSHSSRSRDYHRHRSKSYERHRSRSNERHRSRSYDRYRRHRSKKHSRSHKSPKSRSRSRSRSRHSKPKDKDEIKTELNTSIEEEEEEEPISKENAFKNDGSFLEMFKKMQEEQQKVTADAAANTEQHSSEAGPSVAKRRGGRILKTGMVEKVKPSEDSEMGQGFDAWSVYMNEVRRYKEACCDDDSKTRPLVK